jgi:hypothetical protein
MAHKIERLKAKQLYCEEGKSVGEIAKTPVNGKYIDEKTLYRWAKEDGWDHEREALHLTSFSAYKQTLKIVSDKFNEIALSGVIDAKEIDALKKLVKSARELYKEVDEPGNALLGMSMYAEFMHDKYPEELEKQLPFITEFGQYVRTKYFNKNKRGLMQ